MAVVAANIVTETDGIPVLYKECRRGFGIRVVHPQNPKAPSQNFSVQLMYLAPGGVLEPHHHENEEVYVLLEGEGEGSFGVGKPVRIKPGMFFHFPKNAEHGLRNTGDKMMKILITTCPPFPPSPEWQVLGSPPPTKER